MSNKNYLIVLILLIASFTSFGQNIKPVDNQIVRVYGVGAMNHGVYFVTTNKVDFVGDGSATVTIPTSPTYTMMNFMLYETDPNYQEKVATLLTAFSTGEEIDIYLDNNYKTAATSTYLKVDRLWAVKK